MPTTAIARLSVVRWRAPCLWRPFPASTASGAGARPGRPTIGSLALALMAAAMLSFRKLTFLANRGTFLTINPISNLEIFNNAIKNWNAGDLDGYLNMYDASVLLYGYSPEPLDKAGVVARYKAAWANLSMPGKKGPLLTIDDVFEAGDRVRKPVHDGRCPIRKLDELFSDGQEIRSAGNHDPEVSRWQGCRALVLHGSLEATSAARSPAAPLKSGRADQRLLRCTSSGYSDYGGKVSCNRK